MTKLRVDIKKISKGGKNGAIAENADEKDAE
jgi:hypothetical protein